MAEEGLVSIPSRHSAAETMQRLLAALKERDLTVFARIDHAANAAAVGMELRPTEVVLFGNPKGGTMLMQDQQRAGIDLPLKALIWEDAAGEVWLSYLDRGARRARREKRRRRCRHDQGAGGDRPGSDAVASTGETISFRST
jgi:uncharacterized protein (DUF302 family)